jgi:CRP-like cAMP-binding protein
MHGSAAAALTPCSASVNELLERCPVDVARRWATALQPVHLLAHRTLYAADSRITHVYFPLTAIVAVEHWRVGGQVQTVTVIGCDGVAGASVLLAPDSGPERATVMVAGTALRLDAAALVDEFRRGGELTELMSRYLQSCITQVAQTAFCNRHHGMKAQLCLRLLQLIGPLEKAEFALPQADIGELVGARRERINQLLGELRTDGTVELPRGRVRVVSREGLLREVCDCHGVLEAARRRALGLQR